MRTIKLCCLFSVIIIVLASCGPFESGVLDTGLLNTGGTDDPRRLIKIAHKRMYESNRTIGARNVLKRAIERSQKSGDLYALAVSYNMIAYTYIDREKDPYIAKKYYTKARTISTDNNYYCELVHTYIGFALINNLIGIPENSCVYEKKARDLIHKIRLNLRREVLLCEGGVESIRIAEKRLKELNDYLNCEVIE